MRVCSKFVFIALVVGLWLSPVVAAQVAAQDWELKRDRNGVQVYTRSVQGSPHKALRTVTQLKGVRLASIVALLLDSEACAEWVDPCKLSYATEKVSAVERYVYTLSDLPWPIKNRDILAHVTWQQDPDSFVVTMQSTATVGIIEEKRGIVRLNESQVQWVIIPLAGGIVDISNEVHVNPGGRLPGWVTNMLLVDAPYKTMIGLRRMVLQEKYQDARIDFIKESGENQDRN